MPDNQQISCLRRLNNSRIRPRDVLSTHLRPELDYFAASMAVYDFQAYSTAWAVVLLLILLKKLIITMFINSTAILFILFNLL